MNEIQITRFHRRSNGVWAFKILGITDKGELVFKLPESFGNQMGAMPVSKPENYRIGQYVDMILNYTIQDGKASSYQADFLGLTPQEFIPENSEEIAKS